MDVVNEILQKAAKDSEKFKPITVEKHLDVEIDLGNLLTSDTNEIDLGKLRLVKHVFVKPNHLRTFRHYWKLGWFYEVFYWLF